MIAHPPKHRLIAPVALLLAMLATLLTPATGHAAYDAPIPLTYSNYADMVHAVMDDDGATHLVFYDYPDGAVEDQIMYQKVSASGVAEPAIVVDGGGSYSAPRVAIDVNGTAHVVWLEGGTPSTLHYTRVFSNRTVDSSIVLDPAATSSVGSYVRMATDAGGNAHVVWALPDPSPDPSAVAGRYRYVENGVAAPLETFTPQLRSYQRPDVAAGAAGVAEIVWPEMSGDRNVLAATAVDGVIGTPSALSADISSEQPRVAIDGDGNVHYTWLENDGGYLVRYARRVAGSLQPTLTLNPTTLDGDELALAVDAGGIAHVAWVDTDTSAERIAYTQVTGGDTTSGSTFVSDDASDAYTPHVAAGVAGQAALVWQMSAPSYSIRARRASGSVLSDEVVLIDSNYSGTRPALAGSVSGLSSVAWVNNDDNVELAIGAAPPSCSAASATVQQGQSVTVDASCTGAPTSLAIESGPTSGTIGTIDAAAGTIQYTAATSFTGTATFTYSGTNAGGPSAAATVTITVTASTTTTTTTPTTCPTGQTGTPPNCTTPTTTCAEGEIGTPPNCVAPRRFIGGTASATFTGTAANDTFQGGSGSERFLGGDGNDTGRGGRGSDRLSGERGNDRLEGGLGDDRLFGGPGIDRLIGNEGNDLLWCGSGGREFAFGGDGNDTINCRDGAGGDTINGGRGIDTCIGDRGDVFLGCERELLPPRTRR